MFHIDRLSLLEYHQRFRMSWPPSLCRALRYKLLIITKTKPAPLQSPEQPSQFHKKVDKFEQYSSLAGLIQRINRNLLVSSSWTFSSTPSASASRHSLLLLQSCSCTGIGLNITTLCVKNAFLEYHPLLTMRSNLQIFMSNRRLHNSLIRFKYVLTAFDCNGLGSGNLVRASERGERQAFRGATFEGWFATHLSFPCILYSSSWLIFGHIFSCQTCLISCFPVEDPSTSV